jgi:hypothetical protein
MTSFEIEDMKANKSEYFKMGDMADLVNDDNPESDCESEENVDEDVEIEEEEEEEEDSSEKKES